MISRMNEIREFLNKVYVPVGLKVDYLNLLSVINYGDFRRIEDSDEGKSFQNALVIYTKGRGLYETFQGYKVCRVDVGHVSNTMADVAIYESDVLPVKPLRINKGNIKINLPE